MEGELVEPDLAYSTIDPVLQDDLRSAFGQLSLPMEVLRTGDILVTHSGHGQPTTWNAGVYVVCALILDFGGYGFELQGGTHGRDVFATELFDALEAA
jgi:hypothetical protein